MAEQRGAAPKPEEIYIVPTSFISSMQTISERLEGSSVKWSIMGDTAELIQGVSVTPENVEILVDKEGLQEFSSRLSEYAPPPFALEEKQLERTALVQEKEHPVYIRSLQTRFVVGGVEVLAHSEYQVKVGEWEWGDTLEYEPVKTNIAGVWIPLMPIRVASEIYLMLGWADRANAISDAVHRAHHRLDFGF